jgi:hypothetical protein
LSERKGKRKRVIERERERGRKKESAGYYISKMPGQNEKSANYIWKSVKCVVNS